MTLAPALLPTLHPLIHILHNKGPPSWASCCHHYSSLASRPALLSQPRFSPVPSPWPQYTMSPRPWHPSLPWATLGGEVPGPQEDEVGVQHGQFPSVI